MTFSPVVVFHVCTGTISLLAGAAVLFAPKGSPLHRTLGKVFVVAMLSMSLSGAYRAYLGSRILSVLMGVLTFYLVTTAWMTIRRKTVGMIELGAMLVALTVGISLWVVGWGVLHSASGLRDGIPAGPFFFFGCVALIAAALDMNMLIRGGVFGAHRLARHLWRMCFALLIAVVSLFIGQAQVFPEAVRQTQILNVPVFIVLGFLIYWLSRVLFTNRFKTIQKH